jgi:hypothetical protein
MKRALPLLLMTFPVYAACTADLFGTSSGGSSGVPGGDSSGEAPAGARVDVTPARLLTDLQYNNTVAALFGVHSAPLTEQVASHGDVYDNDASGLGSNPRLVEAFETAAVRVAAEAFQTGAVRFECPSADEAACIGDFVERHGLRVFRRPPTAPELGLLVDLFHELRSPPIEDPPEAAAEGVLAAMLQMPAFLFHTALGSGVGGRSRLTGFEVASRLSFALTNSTPDDALLQAAADGELDTEEGVRAAAERLLASDGARRGVFHFVEQWLGIQDVPRLNRDPALFPMASAELGAAMYQETRLFFEDLFWSGGSVTDLFSADHGFVNRELAALYGLSGEFGADFQRTQLPEQRRGVLTQASYLSAHSVFDRSHPIARGVYTLRKIMCLELGSPPNNVGALPEQESEAKTVRELMERHNEGACSSCHQYIDPVGLSFENYDAIGAYRETYVDGSAVDASAEVLLDEARVPVEGGADLSLALAESQTAASCFTHQAMSYMLGRSLTRDDEAAVERIATGSQSLQDVVLNIVVSEPFLYRDVPARESCE